MKIIIQPDPQIIDFIRANPKAKEIAQQLLQAVGVAEYDSWQWHKSHSGKIGPKRLLRFDDMDCFLTESLGTSECWQYGIYLNKGVIILRINQEAFWAKAYSKNGLIGFPTNILNISLKDIAKSLSDISPLANLSQLTSLNLSNCQSLSNIRPLANLSQLTSLKLSECMSLTDIRPLGNFSQLTSLNLANCQSLSNIRPLATLSQLTSLNLSNCRTLSNIRPLATLSQLTSLNLSNCQSLSNIRPLANLSQLTSLNLSGCTSLTNITPLANFSQLTSLDLSECMSLTDISPLANLSQLTSLDLSWCRTLTNISHLANLSQLISLDICGCQSLSDISPLANLSQFTSLDLSNSRCLTNINPLANLSQLTSLNLSGCTSLTNITPLANLSQLTSLNLSECMSLTDISPLANLSQLTSINLSECHSLSDISPLDNLSQLTSLNLSRCDILSNLSPLQYNINLQDINIFGSLRITHLPDFKQLLELKTLNASLHPSIMIDILAHCAVKRKDWALVNKNAKSWLIELELALRDSHPACVTLATSMAIAFPYIGLDLSERLANILPTDPGLDYRPWKSLMLGILQQLGLESLQMLTHTLVEGSWPHGAIGGLAAISEHLIALPDGQVWLVNWVKEINARYEADPAFLKAVAAPWCLALYLLGETSLLDAWIARFTDPDDSASLDAVHLAFANHRLSRGDASGTLRHALRIRAPLVRDGLLSDLANLHLDAGRHDQAAELLFLLYAEDKRSELSLKLAAFPSFLENRHNLHRLLGSCGRNPATIASLLAKAGLEETVDFKQTDHARRMAAREGARVVAMIAGLAEDESTRLRYQLENHLVNIKRLSDQPES